MAGTGRGSVNEMMQGDTCDVIVSHEEHIFPSPPLKPHLSNYQLLPEEEYEYEEEEEYEEGELIDDFD